MKTFRLVGIVLLACAMHGYGQLTVSIDLDPGTPGIQTVRTASVGDMFTAEIVLTVGASGLSSYGISIFFDNVELNLNGSPAATEFLPAGFSFNFTAGVSEESNTTTGMPGLGHVYTFEAGTFGPGPSSATFSIGMVNFTVVSVLDDGLVDVTPGFFNFGVDGAFDSMGGALTPTFVSASIIPEPASGMLLLVGTALFLGWKRWRRAT